MWEGVIRTGWAKEVTFAWCKNRLRLRLGRFRLASLKYQLRPVTREARSVAALSASTGTRPALCARWHRLQASYHARRDNSAYPVEGGTGIVAHALCGEAREHLFPPSFTPQVGVSYTSTRQRGRGKVEFVSCAGLAREHNNSTVIKTAGWCFFF
ncbi:hypothetical protein PoB_007437600 [Plakobranchus ocellatus]|uniref:Uncharacterized protein n=1 Tax=Plakobranchus ocellatus TaxID=259542 RepID=A0AAV4DUU2_9GAST|nr:hypothetical protein PoB_007437600 [Plakobranchus ocellatus]